MKGRKIEALLGDEVAKARGILTINKGGCNPHTNDKDPHKEINSITTNIHVQAAGIHIKSEKDHDKTIPKEEQDRVRTIMGPHIMPFLGIGLPKDEQASFHLSQPPTDQFYQRTEKN